MRCRVFSPRTLIVPAAAAVLAAVPLRCFAWSAHGHEMVGRVAQDLLLQGQDAVSQTTVANLKQLLGPSFDLAALAPCADHLKRENERTRKTAAAGPNEPQTVSCAGLQFPINTASALWHYIDIPTSADPQTSQDLEAWCGGGSCVVDQIRADIQTLQASRASDDEKKTALMYLVHLVGDEHQPLHCAMDNNDHGGNDKAVLFGPDFPLSAADRSQLAQDAKHGEFPELHALWDQIIEPVDDLDVGTLAQTMEADIQGRTPDELSAWVAGVAGDGDVVTQAALESFHIARDVIYPRWRLDAAAKGPDEHPTVTVTAQYQNDMQGKYAEAQIEKGGYRLMTLLKQALGQSAALQSSAAQTSPANAAAAAKAADVSRLVTDVQAKLAN